MSSAIELDKPPGPPGQERCPRCGAKTVDVRRTEVINERRQGGDYACSARDCSWPRPEPGPINLVRYRMGAGANRYLQELRSQGLWPPVP